MTGVRAGLGAGALAAAVAAVAMAGLLAVPGADTQAAYAQSTPVEVKIGALVANATGSIWQDDYRLEVIRHAVTQFNNNNADIFLNLSVTQFVRTATMDMEEAEALITAYDSGSGPQFYIGPTTSQGLVNILGNSTSKGLLDSNNVLLVSPSSEAPDLAMDDNIFRLAFNVARQGEILVDEMKSAGITSYVVVARDDAWGRQAADAVEARAAQEGLENKSRVTFSAGGTAADWGQVNATIASRIGTVPDGERVGVVFLGYDDNYPNMTTAANSTEVLRSDTAWFAPSSAGIYNPSNVYDTRDFSAAVGITTLSQDVESNAVTMGIDNLRTDKDGTFYEYSTYDSVFVLGSAMRMAMDAGGDANDVATVKKYMAHAAMNYTGAALGDDLLLDGNGDLRAPDKFTVHKVNRTTGAWYDGGMSSSTVTRIGALVALDSTDYSDNKPYEAMREAAADYNNAASGSSLVKVIGYDITDPSDSAGYVARSVLERAYAGGNGSSVYVGPSLSSNVQAVLDYAAANDILLLGYASESESLSTPDDNLFRTAISSARHGHFMAQVMADAGVSSVVTVVRDDVWGRSVNSSIAEALAANGLRSAGVVTFTPGAAASAIGDIATAIAGSEDVGVAFVGVEADQDAVAAAANATLTGVPWFVTPSGYYADMPSATREFAKAVNLTAIVLDVADSATKSALDARVSGLDFYGYSAYDGVFILGNAIASVVESGKTSGINATDLRIEMHDVAAAYEGVLGDIVLNTNGDLRSPDRFAVWKVDATSGMWENTGVTKQTPVVEIGALMAIDSTDYPDNMAWEAFQRAVTDYNGAGERAVYLNPNLYDITNQSDKGKYVVAEVLERAYASGSGPSVYVGPSLSSNVHKVLDYAAANDILLLGYASESESLSTPDDNLFRTAITTDRQGHFMAQVMADAGVTSVVTVVRDDAWGLSLNSSIAEALAANDLELAGAVKFADMGEANWTSTIAEISAAINGSDDVGVAFVAAEAEQDALALAAQGNTVITNVTWFATPSGYYKIENQTTRDFAKAVNLTAIVLDVEDNAKKAALDARVPGLDFYGYSAYDGVFILGNAIEAVVGSGKTSGINADDLRNEMHVAANEYEGVLGDITLNTNGDLRSPDRFAVWMVNSTGNWTETGATKETPIVEIGALMAIDSTDYADNMAWKALVRAGVDYNGADERAYYLNPNLYDITDPSDSAGYVASSVLERAYASGSGPSVYVGPSLSSNVEAVLGYAATNDITLLGFASESESLSIADDNLFRTAISTARHGHFMAQVMADAEVRTVVTVVRNDSWGRSMNSSIAEALAPNGLRSAGVVAFAPGMAASAVGDIATKIGDGQGVGVAFVGVRADQDAVAAAANATLTGVPWFVTPSGYYADMAPATRDFAKAVSLKAIVLDVEDNTKKSALDARVSGLDFYSYSAYDSLFVLGKAFESAAAGGNKNTSSVTSSELQMAIPGAADEYEGVLGDIALNSKGDLRSPDRFAVWQVDETSGMWTNTGVTKQTPVVDIGAIVILESPNFDDSPRLAAMRVAVEEYNRNAEDGGALYLNLRVVQTSLSPGAATETSPTALDAVRAASGGEGGIKYYAGPSTSGNSKRVLEFANANNLTLISPSSTAPSLALEGDALFRLVPNDNQQGKVLADIVHNQQGAILAALIDQTGHEHVVMVVRNDTWGQGLDGSTSGRLGVHDVDITRIIHDEADADWSKTAMEIQTEILRVREATPNDPIAVLHIGFPGDFIALAAQNATYREIGSVPWFGTDGVAGSGLLVGNDTARQFAEAVNLTATKFDVESNEKFDRLTATLVSRGVEVRTTYEYSAYDSIFVLGRAIEAAIAAKDASSYGPLDVRSSVRTAASAYEGALGDIDLNRAGDLRTPNSYATWKVQDGAWNKSATHPSTPVFDIGALLMLDNNPIYTDDRELAAMRVAVDDFNTEHELIGDFYVNLAVQRISISPTDTASPDPDALAGLKNIYAGGDGPSYYVGPSTSGNTGRVLNYSNDNGIVLISHSSTAPALARPGDNLFRMVVPDSLQGIVLGDLIAMDNSVTDLVMAVRGDTWGRGVDEKTTERMGSSTNVSRVMFPESGADWPAVAARLSDSIVAASSSADAKDNGKAAVLFIGFDGDFIAAAAQAAQNPRLGTVQWFGPDGIGNSATVAANSTATAFARDVNMTTVIYSVAPNDVNRRLDPMAVYGPSAYDSLYVMGNAIKAAYSPPSDSEVAPQPPSGTAVRDAIPSAAAAYAGALGNLTLDANGDLSSPTTYAVYRMGADDMWMQVRVVDAGAPTCGLSLGDSPMPTIAFGNINVGSAVSSPMTQPVMSTGLDLDTMTIEATPWTATVSKAKVMEAGATEYSLGGQSWTDLSETPIPVTVDDLSGSIMFRLDVSSANPSATVDIKQTVTYTVTCRSP